MEAWAGLFRLRAPFPIHRGRPDGRRVLLLNCRPLQMVYNSRMNPQVELLAPARNLECGITAIDAGAGDEVTVLDLSFDKNRDAVQCLLERGAHIFYADHHFAGDIPAHEALDCHIDPAADTCTSLIVNALLDNAHWRWAVVGAFGDRAATLEGVGSSGGESVASGASSARTARAP